GNQPVDHRRTTRPERDPAPAPRLPRCAVQCAAGLRSRRALRLPPTRAARTPELPRTAPRTARSACCVAYHYPTLRMPSVSSPFVLSPQVNRVPSMRVPLDRDQELRFERLM